MRLLVVLEYPISQCERQLGKFRKNQKRGVNVFLRHRFDARRMPGIISRCSYLASEGWPVLLNCLSQPESDLSPMNPQFIVDGIQHAFDLPILQILVHRLAQLLLSLNQGVSEFEDHALRRTADHNSRCFVAIRIVGFQCLVQIRLSDRIQSPKCRQMGKITIWVRWITTEVLQGSSPLIGHMTVRRAITGESRPHARLPVRNRSCHMVRNACWVSRVLGKPDRFKAGSSTDTVCIEPARDCSSTTSRMCLFI